MKCHCRLSYRLGSSYFVQPWFFFFKKKKKEKKEKEKVYLKGLKDEI
jgi:hypothetical protein